MKSTCWPSRLKFDYQPLTKPDICSCMYEERSLIDVFKSWTRLVGVELIILTDCIFNKIVSYKGKQTM